MTKRRRTKLNKDGTVKTSIVLPFGLYRRLDVFVESEGVSRSETIRNAVDEYLVRRGYKSLDVFIAEQQNID